MTAIRTTDTSMGLTRMVKLNAARTKLFTDRYIDTPHGHSHSHGDHDHGHTHSHEGGHGHSHESPSNHGRHHSQKYRPTDSDMDKLRSTLKQFVRDWSEEVFTDASRFAAANAYSRVG